MPMAQSSCLVMFPILMLVLFASGCVGQDGNWDTASGVQFNAPAQLPDATINEPYIYSFCQPDRTDANDLCGSSVNPSTNPTGGNEPYHFQLDSGSGFPPMGLILKPNGILSGTPTAAGSRDFTVCAVDLSEKQRCVQTSLNVVEPPITVDPDYMIVKGKICFNAACEISDTITITSTAPWHISFATGSAGNSCFDPVAEFARYWSFCPSSGPAGTTTVKVSTMMYGESTPDYIEEPMVDRGSTIRFALVDDDEKYAELRLGLEIPYYNK